MKALSIHQPHASLVVAGVKRIETRSYPAPAGLVGQRLAIHSTRKEPAWTAFVGDWRLADRRGDSVDFRNLRTGEVMRMPLGAVVGSCVLEACAPMVDLMTGEGEETGDAEQFVLYIDGDQRAYWADRWLVPKTSADDIDVTDQLPYGVFEPGRWAWLLTDAQPTTVRCPWCWGNGSGPDWSADRARTIDEFVGPSCPVCDGRGQCEPIRARGRSKVWNWDPTEAS